MKKRIANFKVSDRIDGWAEAFGAFSWLFGFAAIILFGIGFGTEEFGLVIYGTSAAIISMINCLILKVCLRGLAAIVRNAIYNLVEKGDDKYYDYTVDNSSTSPTEWV